MDSLEPQFSTKGVIMNTTVRQPTAGYKKVNHDNSVEFIIPASKFSRSASSTIVNVSYFGAIIAAPIFGGILTLIIGAALDLREGGLVMWAIISILLFLLIIKNARKRSGIAQGPSQFMIEPDKIIISDHAYVRSEIGDLIIFNSIDNALIPVSTTGLDSAIIGNVQNNATKGGFCIKFHYGDDEIMIADRMSLPTCEKLAKDLKDLGFLFRS